MEKLNIAVIGSGISGLSSAWLLSKKHRVTLYEADDRFGGHSNTVMVETENGAVPVDTGFMVYNRHTYPNLIALFEHLGVGMYETDMSFSVSVENGRYEYSGTGFQGFFGQKSNLVRPRHWWLLADIARFFKHAESAIGRYPAQTALGSFLRQEGYGRGFVDNHILPMAAAIWSSTPATMLDFPARAFVDFYANHSLLQFAGRPLWRTIDGGSRRYVEKLIEDGGFERHVGNGITRIDRHPNYVHVVDGRGVSRAFDHVVVATHADQALRMIQDPDPLESHLLGAVAYQHNHAVLHRDQRWMPRRRAVWSSWNYLKSGHAADPRLCVTYWMNSLQNLKTSTDIFVTLNPHQEIHPKAVIAEFNYRHPVFDNAAMEARKSLWALQGTRRTWYAGSYFGFGFHEDGLQSGLAVAEHLGGLRRPWQLAEPSSRIFVTPPENASEVAA